MRLQTELQALGARFGIEETHTGHVASLALDLFDGFSSHGLWREGRVVLQTAAYLHDIGYAADPENHVEAGVRILLENPLSAFPAKDWAMVVGTILLHRRDWRASFGHGLFTAMGDRRLERTKMLAAILRIADSLDHGHVQDARITACRRGKRTDRIGVACGWYVGNLACAADKADLWEAVFKRHLRIEGTAKRPKQPFKRIVQPKDSAAGAARRILYSQYDVMRDQLPAMRGENVVDGLHDYRVALRRFRSALKLFAPVMGKAGGFQRLEKKLGKLSDRLGPVRDTHVFWRFVQDRELAQGLDAALLESLEADFAKANQTLVGILESAETACTILDMNRLLRIELPALERAESSARFKDHVKAALSELMEEILSTQLPARDAAPEAWHELRKRCRKARYYAEFAAPACGKAMEKMAKKLNKAASALGDLRDAQNLIDRLRAAGCTAAMSDALAVRRQEAWKRFKRGWKSRTLY
jgi:CHAD domain-containing protein